MPVRFLKSAVSSLASTKLTIISVAALVVLSLVGTTLPQSSDFSAAELAAWKDEHPVISAVAEPLGAFRMFSSIPFFAVAILVTTNLAFNTAVRFKKTRRQIFSRAAATLPVKAHIVIHGGLLLLAAGVAMSMLFKLDGTVVLTEGQLFHEGHESYHSLREGPLFGETHKEYVMRLEKFNPTYVEDQFPVDYSSTVRVAFGPGDEIETALAVNRPAEFRGVKLTQDVFGFSPMIRILEGDVELVRAFLALNTFRTPQGLRFTDYLVLDEGRRLVFEVLPDFNGSPDDPRTRTPVPRNPALRVWQEQFEDGHWGRVAAKDHERDSGPAGASPEAGGAPVEARDLDAAHAGGSREADPGTTEAIVRLGESGHLAGYEIFFEDLRYWSKFRVVQDPYLYIIYAGLWVSLAGLALRYPVAMFVRSMRKPARAS